MEHFQIAAMWTFYILEIQTTNTKYDEHYV